MIHVRPYVWVFTDYFKLRTSYIMYLHDVLIQRIMALLRGILMPLLSIIPIFNPS